MLRPCYTGGEPGTRFHHTVMTSAAQMIAAQHKWFRWLGEESLSGGKIGLYEGGNYYPCGTKRPSQHSMMRWLGFDCDQVGLEHMVARITGMRNARPDERAEHAAAGTVAKDSVLWVETGHPRFHELKVTWRIGGPTGEVIAAAQRQPQPRPGAAEPRPRARSSTRRSATPSGPTASTGCATRRPTTRSTNSGYNGSRFVQTRTWTVGDRP